VNRELMAFAKKSFDRFLRQMTMTRADVDNERIWRGSRARQRLAETRIHGLPNQMFDHGAMRCWRCCNHEFVTFLPILEISQQLSCKIFQNLSD